MTSTTTYQAGQLLEELLLSGVLTVGDVANAIGIDGTRDLIVDIHGDTVTVES